MSESDIPSPTVDVVKLISQHGMYSVKIGSAIFLRGKIVDIIRHPMTESQAKICTSNN